MSQNDTPMIRQYKTIKQEQQDAVLFFRLGDFYEMFFEDAREVSQILNLVLTSRNGIPMCGIPHHAAKSYIRRLLDAGKKIAVCEQKELPQKGKTLVRREVVQVITPGTVIDEDFLVSDRSNYICAAAGGPKGSSVAYADLSTGEFIISDLGKDPEFKKARALIMKLQPSEILIEESRYYEDESFRIFIDNLDAMAGKYPDWMFSIPDASKVLTEHFATVSLKQFGIDSEHNGLLSSGVLFRYIQQNAKTQLEQIRSIREYREESFLQLDESALRNLEVIRNLQDGSERYTLFSAIDFTKTAAGARLLRRWLIYPLADLEAIAERLDTTERFYLQHELVDDCRRHLAKVLDLQRLITRILMNRYHPKDLLAVAYTIESAGTLYAKHEQLLGFLSEDCGTEDLQRLYELSQEIISAVNEDLKGVFVEGQTIKDGYDAELDAQRHTKRNGRQLLDAYLQEMKESTGISNIKLRSNRILGHYLEVSKANSHLVPETFLRKQTLVQGERYTTDELIALERTLIDASEKSENVERQLLERLVGLVIDAVPYIQELSESLAVIDCYQSFAFCAVKRGYVRPQIVKEDLLDIELGRHPVVESLMDTGNFIPNSLRIEEDVLRTALITGPNMSGKSTFLRQNALIVLLCHMGSFVPAEKAVIGLTDAIFCRVGASDNLVRGESTFLVEMNETAFILRNATSSSLVIMDEVGRGTSSRDGLSIAYAVLKKLVEMGSKTLFATHYHELTEEDDIQMRKLFLDAHDDGGRITFLKQVKEGTASSSYGLHVADLAGIPKDVLHQARLYRTMSISRSADQPDLFIMDMEPEHGPSDELKKMISSYDINRMTPLEALGALEKLQKKIQDD